MKQNFPASDDAETDGLARWSLLASALSGRTLEVKAAAPGEPAWTDGSAIFIDADTDTRRQLSSMAVQASLLAAGSLDREVVRRVARRRALARRYLAVEGHRALASIEDLLPPSVRSLIDPGVAARADSPAASLASALSTEAIPDPPDAFGVIRARQLLASKDRAAGPVPPRDHASREQPDPLLAELADDESDRAGVESFSSPVGGGGSIGRLLQRMLKVVRRLDDGVPPGADAPTRWTRDGMRGIRAVLSKGTAERTEVFAIESRGTKYPEWDFHRRRYLEDWCTVKEVEPQPPETTQVSAPGGHALRRPLARLGLGLDRCHRQAQGGDIDIDAAVEARVAVMAGAAPDEAFYIDSVRRRRDLSVLVLLDVSGSAAEPGSTGATVHEEQRAAAAALTTALYEIGDRVALYAYHSRGRSAVQLAPIKRFDDALDSLVMRRLQGLVPVAYSRLGAAIRHGASVLEGRGGTPRRLLVVLSDGLAYDHGYEPAYGAADARRALAEARRRGTACLCLSVGSSTDVETLRRVFGSAAHAAIPRTQQLSRVIAPLFRSALRSAEARPRMSAGGSR